MRRYTVVLEITVEKVENGKRHNVLDHKTIEDYVVKSLPKGVIRVPQGRYSNGQESEIKIALVEVVIAGKRKAEFE